MKTRIKNTKAATDDDVTDDVRTLADGTVIKGGGRVAAAKAAKAAREEKKAARLAGDAPLDAMFSEFSAGDSASAQEAADKDDEYEAFLQGNGAPSHCLLLCSRLGYRLILAARVQGFYQGRRNALVIDVDRYSPMSCGPPRPAR